MTDGSTLPTRVAVAWGVLIAATLSSWWLGTDHGIGNAEAAGTAVLLVAFVKVRIVGRYFMELRDAPTVLRAAFDGWCVGVCAIVLGLYVLG